jgi:hypothetical protein
MSLAAALTQQGRLLVGKQCSLVEEQGLPAHLVLVLVLVLVATSVILSRQLVFMPPDNLAVPLSAL